MRIKDSPMLRRTQMNRSPPTLSWIQGLAEGRTHGSMVLLKKIERKGGSYERAYYSF
jgi:hypothetical protein